MSVLLDDDDVTLHVGDAVDVLRGLPDRCVHSVLTSPPFFGLRDYGTAVWHEGDPDCDHKHETRHQIQGASSQRVGRTNVESQRSENFRNVCGKCGARRVDRQIGLEDSPDEWAAALVAVFAECRRVLRDDGTLWVEVGDGYGRGRSGRADNGVTAEGRAAGWQQFHAPIGSTERRTRDVKDKDLIGAPFLLAFALRADGWFWRGCYIWEKPDAMPESATDRCTVSHSYLLHFSKSARYFHDQDAIREAFSPDGRRVTTVQGTHNSEQHRNGERWPGLSPEPTGQLDLNGDEAPAQGVKPQGGGFSRKYAEAQPSHGAMRLERPPDGQGRNARSVWRIATEASSFGLCPACRTYWDSGAPAQHCGVDVVAHFATWPHALAGRIIACATSEEGCCPYCHAPWERERERTPMVIARSERTHDLGRTRTSGTMLAPATSKTVGWRPTCDHGHQPIPCTVLDPFAGSGTTARQARKMGRRSIQIELNPDYAAIAAHRLQQLSLFA